MEEKCTESREDIWRHNGKMLGYPECCIESFVGQHPLSRTEDQYAIGNLGLGFIPCPKHAKEVVQGGRAIETLITNRDPSFEPFPNE